MTKIILRNNTTTKQIKQANQIEITVQFNNDNDRAKQVFNQLSSTNNYTCEELSSGQFGGTYLFIKK